MKQQGILTIFSILFIFISRLALAAPAANYQMGKDYQKVSAPMTSPVVSTPGKVTVIEFFSYGCPWCYEVESSLPAWRKAHAKDVVLQRVPVEFEKGWDMYAKAYYLARSLGIEKKITPVLFRAIQKDNKKLTTVDSMVHFFVQQGVSQEMAQSALTHSLTIDAQLAKGIQLLQAYQVYVVPSFVVDGKYRTDLRAAGGKPKRLLAIVAYLIHKVQHTPPKQSAKS